MNSVPEIFVLSALAATVAIVGFFVVHRFMKPVNLEEHQGFLDAMLSIVGTLVSILLGLLVASALDHYQTLEQSVDNEAAALAQIFRLTVGLPDQQCGEIRKLCGDYCTEVVNDEWPLMASGEMSTKVVLTSLQLGDKIIKFVPSNDGQTNIQAALLSQMQDMSNCRRQRLLSLHSPWKQHLMPVLVMCSVIVLAFAFMYARRGARLHAVLICLVAVALGANLSLIYLLSNPFSGDWRIQPKAFQYNLQLLQKFQCMPELKPYMGK